MVDELFSLCDKSVDQYTNNPNAVKSSLSREKWIDSISQNRSACGCRKPNGSERYHKPRERVNPKLTRGSPRVGDFACLLLGDR